MAVLISAVPLIHFLILTIKEIDFSQETSLEIVVNLIYILSSISAMFISTLFLYFKIRPFRKRSIYWSLNNNFEFFSHVLNLTRVFVIVIDGYSIAVMMVSFAL